MKKVILLLISLFLVTGCSVQYDVLIDDDLKVHETSKIMGSDDLYELYYKTSKVHVLEDLLENYQDDLKNNNYSFKLYKESNPYIILEREYNDIQNYLNNSKLFNDYFDKMSYNVSGNIIKIETEGFNPNEEDNPDRFNVSDINISITSKYQVVNSNASKIDKDTNTYHFIINNETTDFKIILEIDTSKKFNANSEKIVMIIIAIIFLILAWVIILIVKRKREY